MIFQPGEEGYAGAKAMIQDGLFERFPAAGRIRHAQLARHAARHRGHQSGRR
jgi:metal-dependent amidase/aminoacylase/carboxypeptidase family protein